MHTPLKIFFIPFCVLLFCAFASHDLDKVRKQPKFKDVPPGTVWLRDSTFIDMTEIRNLDYLEFLYWTGRERPAKYKSLLPDTLCWRTIYPDSVAFSFCYYYMRHPSYRNYPVVGISYEQAIAFCEWRTDRVNAFIMIRNKEADWPGTDTMTHFIERVHYRLPTKEEWEYASQAGLNYTEFPFGYESLTDDHHLEVSNTAEYCNVMSHSVSFVYKHDHQSISTECIPSSVVYSGKENGYGIFNLLGNVSEIIADSSFKGLNYHAALDGTTFRLEKGNYSLTDSTANNYDYRYTFQYNKPQPWLGFRCVCDVLK